MIAMRLLLFCGCLCLAGCGYVGDPLPPALNIPVKITDLQVAQRGNRIHVEFTAPALTTEGLAIEELDAIDLRIGPAAGWPEGGTTVEVPSKEPGPFKVDVDSAAWTGQEITVGVRAGGPKDRFGEWSDVVRFRVTPPLTSPSGVKAESHPEGVRLSWDPKEGVQYRVSRQAEAGSDAVQLGVVTGGEYVDRGVVLGRTRSYIVQSVIGLSESPPSDAVTITPADIFPPAPPSGISILAGIGSVELAWKRNTELDLKSYRVYRSSGSDPMAVLADSVDSPAYSDRQVTAGTKYVYSITALDSAGNESAKSTPVEMTAP